jgi:hypothetical protein
VSKITQLLAGLKDDDPRAAINPGNGNAARRSGRR